MVIKTLMTNIWDWQTLNHSCFLHGIKIIRTTQQSQSCRIGHALLSCRYSLKSSFKQYMRKCQQVSCFVLFCFWGSRKITLKKVSTLPKVWIRLEYSLANSTFSHFTFVFQFNFTFHPKSLPAECCVRWIIIKWLDFNILSTTQSHPRMIKHCHFNAHFKTLLT